MKVSHSFQAERKFWDDEHFPYGFSRSGDFTLEQAALLEQCGHAYRALANGEREPSSQEEKDFVAFCRGVKEASSGHEKAWKRYQEKVNFGTHRYLLASTPKSVSDSAIDLDDSDSLEDD